MTYDKTQTIGAFLDAAAAKQPTPGGGSVAALAGALAATMGEMVLNYSVNKKDLAEHHEELKRGLARLHSARQMMVEMMVEDQSAYEALSAIKKLPASADRDREMKLLVSRCIAIPQSIASTSLAILRICDELVEKSNRYLLSDLAVCAELAMATHRSAAYNVRVNLADVSSEAAKSAIQEELSQQLAAAVKLIQSIIPRIWSRVG